MKYTVQHFRKEFPTNQACLAYIYRARFPKGGYYPIAKRKSYADKQGKQVHPLKGTIFEKSSTPLLVWFEAIYLFSVAKNGISAKELQRHFGVTYKCAWRMAYQIRLLMEQGKDPLSGVVEADEAYLRGRKIPMSGAVQRGGGARVRIVQKLSNKAISDFMVANVSRKAELMTDASGILKPHRFPKLQQINKSKEGYVRGKVHINSIEGFWSHVKRSINGTYCYISEKHAQHYLDQFSYLYERRNSAEPIFLSLLARAVGQ